jgi:hypothetical protein
LSNKTAALSLNLISSIPHRLWSQIVFNTLATIAAKGAGFRSLKDTCADTTTVHRRLGRKPTLSRHQHPEAIKRLKADKETRGEIARSYNVSRLTIARLT